MKPVAFDYARPAVLAEALAQIADDPGAKPLAGGQSLGPMMNLRVAKPSKLVDISRLVELRGQCETTETVTIGACVTHAEIEDGKVVDPSCGLLKHVAGRIAYRAVRNRGTIGGAIAHADPAADWLCALTATGATLIIAGPAKEQLRSRFAWLRPGIDSSDGRQMRRIDIRSFVAGPYASLLQSNELLINAEIPKTRLQTRKIDIRSFIAGPYTTSLQSNELLIGVEIPKASPEMRWGYVKFCRKVGELADAIGAVVIDPQRRFARVVAGSVGGAPLLLEAATRKLAATAAPPSFGELLTEIGAALPRLDAVKRQHVAISVERAIGEALSR